MLHDAYGVGISLSFVIATVASMIPASIMLVRGGSRVFRRPDWQSLRRLLPVAINHNWLNLAMATPSRIIPIVVTVVVGGAGGGVFYVVWMISSLLFMVPVHLGTVLFALASASPELVAEKLRFVLRVSLMIGLPIMVVLAIGAHFMLGIYKPVYAQLGTVPLWLLIIGYIPQMPRAQFIAVSRATNKVGQAAGLLCFFAACEVVSIYHWRQVRRPDRALLRLPRRPRHGGADHRANGAARCLRAHGRRDRGLPGRLRHGPGDRGAAHGNWPAGQGHW